MITPKKAQEQTEERWQQIVAGAEDVQNCGWCEFIDALDTSECSRCPIYRVHGCHCIDTEVLARYHTGHCGAGQVLRHLQSMGAQYIEEAHRILLEESA